MASFINENWSEERPYCIYRHTSPSGKVYIGQTKHRDLNERWRNGRGYAAIKGKVPFRIAIEKYGWDNFTHEIIESGLTKDEANDAEIKWISYYRELGICYNGTKVGSTDKRDPSIPEDIKRKISDSLKGRFGGKNSPTYGKTWTKGHKRIYKGDEVKTVPPEELQSYLDNGWIQGNHPDIIEKAAAKRRGCTNTPESNEKRAAALRDIPRSQEVKDKISKANAHRTYINKDGIEKFVKPDELEDYLNDGWIMGRCKSRASLKSQSEKMRNKRFVYKDNREIMVDQNDIQAYVADGWIPGRSPESVEKMASKLRGRKLPPETSAKISASNKGKIISKETRMKISASHSNRVYISKNGVDKAVHLDELQKYLDDGWIIGRTEGWYENRGMSGRKFMYKDGVQITVRSEDIQEYLDNGWKFGFIKHSKAKN